MGTYNCSLLTYYNRDGDFLTAKRALNPPVCSLFFLHESIVSKRILRRVFRIYCVYVYVDTTFENPFFVFTGYARFVERRRQLLSAVEQSSNSACTKRKQ